MTSGLLFTRTRRWTICLILIGATGLLIVACGPLSYTLNPVGGYRVAAASQLPLLAALTIQGALTSPLPRQEQMAARRLWPWRLAHIAVLTLTAAAAVSIAALFIQPPEGVLLNASSALGPLALIRNLLAFTGTALIAAAILGPTLGWLIPLGWAILPAVALSGNDPDPTGLLKLATRPDQDPIPLATAGLIWLLGAALGTSSLRIRRPGDRHG